MKKFLFLALFLVASALLSKKTYGQTVDLFCEDFDTIPFAMTNTGNPASVTPLWWQDTVISKNASPGSATDTVGNRSRAYLTSPKVGISGFNNVGIRFDQICYIDLFDELIVEYSFDGGPFARLPKEINNLGSIERVYTGSSLYQVPSLAFSKLSNSIWPNLNDTLVYTRANSVNAWVVESFNITPVINRVVRQGNPAPDSLQIRIGLIDNPASPIGRSGTHQVWIDNFCIRGSNCELAPPIIRLDDPPNLYPQRYEDRVYWLGPYDFNAAITDQSLINRAYIEYYVKRDTGIGPRALVVRDTIDFTFLGFTRYSGEIPRGFTNLLTNLTDSIRPGDSVCWKVEAVDNSPCFNRSQDPPAGFTCFEVRGNLPVSCFTQPIFRFPHYQTFNGPDFIPSASGVLAENWVNAEGDFHDFYVQQGPTNDYPNTGPSDDLPGFGKYLYLEATGFRDSTAYLLSPCIDLFDQRNTLVRFYLNQNGVGGDTVHVDMFDPTPIAGFPLGRFINDIIPPIGGNKGDNWIPYEFNTFNYYNKVVQMRIRATPSAISENTDIGLDSFKIVPAPVHDLRMNAVILSPFAPSGINDSLTLNILNLGALASTNFTMQYEVYSKSDPINPVHTSNVINYSIPILPGDGANITVEPYPVPFGEYSVKAWLSYVPDQAIPNDTNRANSTGLNYKAADCVMEDFDQDIPLWVGLASDTTGNANVWERGTPTYGRTNTAFTEPNSWDVLLNRGYSGNGGVEQLITQFYDLRNVDSVIMSFMNNRAMTNTKDGVFVEFSIDRGRTWTYIDNLNDPLRKRWYNSNLSAGGFGGQFCFADTTRNMVGNWNNWVESEIVLPLSVKDNKEVLFRFIFFAEDEPLGSAGMSIDNFLIYEPQPIDIEPTFIVRPISQCDLTRDQPFVTVFKNRGLQDVNSFNVTYVVKNLNTQVEQRFTETVSRTIKSRDTIRVKSVAEFNMFEFGDYEVSVITSLMGDACSANDTLTKIVENIEGCDFIFQVKTNNWRTDPKTIRDSSFWRFDYISGGRRYVVTDDYAPWDRNDTIRQTICIKDESFVIFNLGDVDDAVTSYSFIAYNGENDTIIVNQQSGGAGSPTKYINWFCPPERSAKPLEIIINDNVPALPIPGDYKFDVRILNNGLDSINFLEVGLSIDNRIFRNFNVGTAPPTQFPATGLEYNREFLVPFPPSKDMQPGDHLIKAWTHDPNGQADLQPEDDTISFIFTVMDTTARRVIDANGNLVLKTVDKYCTQFELADDTVQWVSANPYNYRQDIKSFELGTPSTDSINGAYSGQRAWVTNLDGNYRNVDSASIYSPLFLFERDSCYKLSFWHNYVIRDLFNDGGQVQISKDQGVSWETMFYNDDDSLNTSDTTAAPVTGTFQKNWHNARNIKAIPDNSQNSGWTGNSNGWIQSENIFGGSAEIITGRDTMYPFYGSTKNYFAVFRWRFESDFTKNDEGWAIDDFCIEKISPNFCFALGLEEAGGIDQDGTYLGQNIPNPASNFTSIPFYLPKAGRVNFTVVNMVGQPVYQFNETMTKGSGYFDIDISNYAAGVYYYWMIFEGKKYTSKMIVTK